MPAKIIFLGSLLTILINQGAVKMPISHFERVEDCPAHLTGLRLPCSWGKSSVVLAQENGESANPVRWRELRPLCLT